MQATKKTFLALSLAVATIAPSLAQQIDLVSLGSPTFTIDSGATTAAYSQTASGVVFNGAYALGDTLGGSFTTQNWSTYTSPAYDFGIVMTLTGTNPDLPFSVQFYDASFNVINTYSGFTTGAGTSTFQPLTLAIAGTGILSSVAGVQFTWDGGGTINATVEKVAATAVPEPSTYALLALGGLAFAGYAMRRRQRA
jgi:hypothetical protein